MIPISPADRRGPMRGGRTGKGPAAQGLTALKAGAPIGRLGIGSHGMGGDRDRLGELFGRRAETVAAACRADREKALKDRVVHEQDSLMERSNMTLGIGKKPFENVDGVSAAFSERFREALRKRIYPNTALHPSQLAHAIGVHVVTLQNWMLGACKPNADAIDASIRFFSDRSDTAFLLDVFPWIASQLESDREAVAVGKAVLQAMQGREAAV